MNIRVVELIAGCLVFCLFFVLPVIFIQLGLMAGFLPVEEKKRKDLRLNKIRAIIFYSLSVMFLLATKELEIAVRHIDMGVKTFNVLTIVFVSCAFVFYALSFYLFIKWIKLRCKKRWQWGWAFFIGAFTFFPNLYLLIRLCINSRDKLLSGSGNEHR